MEKNNQISMFDTQKRDSCLHLTLTEEEKDLIARKAKSVGMCMNRYLIQAVKDVERLEKENKSLKEKTKVQTNFEKNWMNFYNDISNSNMELIDSFGKRYLMAIGAIGTEKEILNWLRRQFVETKIEPTFTKKEKKWLADIKKLFSLKTIRSFKKCGEDNAYKINISFTDNTVALMPIQNDEFTRMEIGKEYSLENGLETI